MISLPPYVLLIVYGAFLLGFLFFAIADIVSLSKYGARNAVGLTTSFIFVCGTAVILFATWQALGPVDWTTPVPLFTVQIPGL